MIAAKSINPKPKLKIKFPLLKTPVPQSFEFAKKLSSSFDEKKKLGGNLESGGAKRRLDGLIMDGPQEKRRKMDRSMTQQCTTLLNVLMKHPAGWVFNQPVDPIALNIPDYFSIIKKPMDLGTIKSKLAKKAYLGIEDFVADIKLTFSNAMLYNPPSNNVHKMAEEMLDFFEARWKTLEEKWTQENLKVGHGKISSVRLKDVDVSRKACPTVQLSRNTSFPKKSKPSEEKVVKVALNARASEVEFPKPARNSVGKFPGKHLQKGTSTSSVSCGTTNGSINAKPPLSPDACKCRSCGSMNCKCSLPCNPRHASSIDVTTERLSGGESGDLRVCSADASKVDCQANITLAAQMSMSDPDSDGAVSATNDVNARCSSHLTTPVADAASSASGEGLSTPFFDAQMSPKKALRAAILKKRFADTILKAQQRTLLDNGDAADPVKLQQEKEKLERRQREEKAKIEAQIKAAEVAAKTKAEAELKKQRESEREAARLALQKMEKTADIQQNLEIVQELERLLGCCLHSSQFHGRKSGPCDREIGGEPYGMVTGENPLHKLGLFFKYEFLQDEDEDEDAILAGEEGEIL